MDTPVLDLLVLLAIATEIFLLSVIALLFTRGRSGSAKRILLDHVSASGLHLAALIAVVATLGSLYLSEVVGLVPCRLCWYQRIAMYPLAVILTIAAIRDDRTVARYAVPIASIGAAIAAYHYQLQRFPDQAHLGCPADGACTAMYLFRAGHLTIPAMAFLAFLAIIFLTVLSKPYGSPAQTADDKRPERSYR